jgi:hypothetical protein
LGSSIDFLTSEFESSKCNFLPFLQLYGAVVLQIPTKWFGECVQVKCFVYSVTNGLMRATLSEEELQRLISKKKKSGV